jgi:hypothetical protein
MKSGSMPPDWPSEHAGTAIQQLGCFRVTSGHGATIANRSFMTHNDISIEFFAAVQNGSRPL